MARRPAPSPAPELDRAVLRELAQCFARRLWIGSLQNRKPIMTGKLDPLRSSHLLAEIPRDRLDASTRWRMDDVTRATGGHATVVTGRVTGRVFFVFHDGRRPTQRFIQRAERSELAAMPVGGGA